MRIPKLEQVGDVGRCPHGPFIVSSGPPSIIPDHTDGPQVCPLPHCGRPRVTLRVVYDGTDGGK